MEKADKHDSIYPQNLEGIADESVNQNWQDATKAEAITLAQSNIGLLQSDAQLIASTPLNAVTYETEETLSTDTVYLLTMVTRFHNKNTDYTDNGQIIDESIWTNSYTLH